MFPNARDGAKYQNDQELAENNSADMLGSMLAPWEIEYANKASMQQNIRGIVKTAASLGLIIVSQPSAYEFCWDTSGLPSTLVIFPAFL